MIEIDEIKKACDEHYAKWLQTPSDVRDCYSAAWQDAIRWLIISGIDTKELPRELIIANFCAKTIQLIED